MRSMHNLFHLMGAVLLVAAIAPLGRAQGARDVVVKDAGEQMVLQTYDVGDLVFSVPDYTLQGDDRSEGRGGGGGGGMGGMGGGFAGGGSPIGSDVGVRGVVTPDPGASPLTMGSIVQTIQATVAPNTWQAADGEGQASALGASLVVLQTPDAQRAIGELLNALREGSGSRRSMTVDARWLVLDSDDLEKLVVVGEDGERTINRETLAEFTRQPNSLRGFVSCFSGQAVYLTSGTVRRSVSSYIPVVGGGEGSVGYQPLMESNNFGAEIELRPTRLYPEEAAVVDLRSTITFPADGLGNEGREEQANSSAPKVDRLAIQTQELATTLRVPLGEPVLVGGMTDVAPRTMRGTGEVAEGAVTGERPQLYLILEVR